MQDPRRASVRLAAAALVATLAGCASTYRLDSTVQSFSGLPALPANPTYRLERLPSQAATAEQARIEALADPALFRAGLRRDDAAPRYSVQVSARSQPVIARSAFGVGAGFGWGGPHFGFGLGMGGPPLATAANTNYLREVGVVVREAATHQVVYESRASSDTFYLNADEVFAAMFDAALAGFPNPPQGPRHVVVQVQPVQPVVAAPAAVPAAAPVAR